MKRDLVGKRKVHKQKGKEGSLGFSYKQLSSGKCCGLFQVSTIKEGGFADTSRLIQSKDVVHSIDGIPCETVGGPMAFAELLSGPVGSSCELELSRGDSPDVFLVTCTRMAAAATGAAAAGGSSDASGSNLKAVVAAAAGDNVGAGRDDDVRSVKSDASQSKHKAVSLGFTYKMGKDGKWKVSTIKSGGWAEQVRRLRKWQRPPGVRVRVCRLTLGVLQSGEIKSGDVLVSVGGKPCSGLDLKAVTRLLQGDEGSRVKLEIEREGFLGALSVEGVRTKCA